MKFEFDVAGSERKKLAWAITRYLRVKTNVLRDAKYELQSRKLHSYKKRSGNTR